MHTAMRILSREESDQALEILADNRDIQYRTASRLLEVENLDDAAWRAICTA
ncbi:MAG: hypothetical protein WAT09_15605 [Paracoccaceae bacterium]